MRGWQSKVPQDVLNKLLENSLKNSSDVAYSDASLVLSNTNNTYTCSSTDIF